MIQVIGLNRNDRSQSPEYAAPLTHPFYRMRFLDKWLPYFTGMLDNLPIRKSAKRCNISVKTAFKWRHQFLSLPNKVKVQSLSGIVEIDETLFRYSEKAVVHSHVKPIKEVEIVLVADEGKVIGSRSLWPEIETNRYSMNASIAPIVSHYQGCQKIKQLQIQWCVAMAFFPT